MSDLVNLQFPVPDSLKEIIIDAYYTQYNSNGTPFSDKHIPQCVTSWVVHFKDTFYVNSAKKKNQVLPTSFFTGFFNNYLELNTINDIESIVCFFKPYGLYRLFKTDMKMLSMNFYVTSSHYINSDVVFNASLGKTPDEKVRYLFEFLEFQALKSDVGTHVVDAVCDEIIANNGIVKISELCCKHKISERYLRRNFETRIGVSAKQMSRIARINYLIRNLPVSNKADWQELVCNCGYTDQAHLINDFKSVTGETPRTFFIRDRRYVNLISYLDSTGL